MRIYLAAPFFSERELEIVQTVESVLTELELEYFSPRLSDTNLLPPEVKYDPANAQAIFEKDIAEMDSCDVCLAMIDGYKFFNEELGKPKVARDMGTAFEMGYMYAQGKPIITYANSPDAANLMLARATVGHFPSVERLIDMLSIASHAQPSELVNIALAHSKELRSDE